jgi:WD40 repeat protein
MCLINSKSFATGGADYLIKIWDIDMGSIIDTLKGHLGAISGL